MKKFKLPMSDKDVKSLVAGEMIYLTGKLYTARDAAHKRLVELLAKGEKMPINFKETNAIYYVGPTPAKPGRVIGSAGPTSSYRMDSFCEDLFKEGLKVTIGKGSRSDEHIELLKKYNCVYLSSIGGAAASISEVVKEAKVIAYEDLQSEAIRELYVEDFPVIVAYDSKGNDALKNGIKKYTKMGEFK